MASTRSNLERRELAQLEYLGALRTDLGECQGDCAGDLKCWKRNYGQYGNTVDGTLPGCIGSYENHWSDNCYDQTITMLDQIARSITSRKD